MKILLLIATLAIAAPAFAATSEPSAPPPAAAPPSAQDAKKADPGKPFVNDANRRPLPDKSAPKKATGPGIG
jgi:hypothetical protein